ncbi:hypothetical protein [Methanosarcina barkeri]|uniref:hypothetical protein n=1 Tax=Methanosarcina barkeri TaxID=2208 RepID=UPI000A75B963|nr:hypothetical protein [Methanosarcina barkeri]
MNAVLKSKHWYFRTGFPTNSHCYNQPGDYKYPDRNILVPYYSRTGVYAFPTSARDLPVCGLYEGK